MSDREEIIAVCERYMAKSRRAHWMVISVSQVEDDRSYFDYGRRCIEVADPDSPKVRDMLYYIEASGKVQWVQETIEISWASPPDTPYVRPKEPLTPEQAAAACREVCWFDEKRTQTSCMGKDAQTGEWLVEMLERCRSTDAMHILVRFNEQTGAAKILRRL